jgi:hypothetical protein
MYVYYVYAYLRASDNTPYYIGKGKGPRYKERHSVSVPKDSSKIVFLETNLSNVGACALERRYIRWYGRKDMGTGILRNKTDGGEGVFGIKRTLPPEHRAKLSAAHKGKKRSPESIAKTAARHLGAKRSDATKAKMSFAQKGRTLSESHLAAIRSRPPITAEQKQKLIENVKKSNHLRMEMGTHYNLQRTECPHCRKTGQDRAMKRWHFSKCKLKV